MSFLYPRLINITRPNPTVGIGALGYQGLDPTEETTIFTNIPASIQHRGDTAFKSGIPADPKGAPVWQIIIPLMFCQNGSILERDIITDDLNNRYQVVAAYWNSLGYQCECERLLI